MTHDPSYVNGVYDKLLNDDLAGLPDPKPRIIQTNDPDLQMVSIVGSAGGQSIYQRKKGGEWEELTALQASKYI